MKNLAPIIFCATVICPSAKCFAEERDDEAQEQDFLFLLEEAYVQEKGEWQVGIAWDRTIGATSDSFEFEVEYGLTDRLQVAMELPVVNDDDASGVGDLEFALDYALLKDEGALAPEFTIGAGAIAPTGGDGTGSGTWGYETSVRVSKQIAEGFYMHGAGAREAVPGGGPDADLLREWSAGAGAALRVNNALTLTGEYIREVEREDEAGNSEKEVESYVTGGLILKISDLLEIGAAGGAGLTEDSADARFIAKFQAEW